MWEFLNTDLLYQSLQDIAQKLHWLVPELILAGLIVTLLLADLIVKKNKGQVLSIISGVGIIATGIVLILQWQALVKAPQIDILGVLELDTFAILFKGIIVFTLILILIFGHVARKQPFYGHGETYIFLVAICLGSFMLTMTTHLLMLYISIELVSLSSYVLTAFAFDKKSAEASLKYFLFGAASSGVMVYGMSLLYGFTGSLDLSSYSFFKGLLLQDAFTVMVASIMVFGGLLFKMSLVPFHYWVPDVYESAPSPIVAFFSIVPKVGAAAAFIRTLGAYNHVSLIFVDVNFHWESILAVIAIASIFVGNIAALRQSSAKRMLGYSSIAHVGFILVGILAQSDFGIKAVLFYVFFYAIANTAAFLLVDTIQRHIGSEQMRDFKGLGHKWPFLGGLMIVVMIALTGLPPTAGFTSKLFIFTSLLESYQTLQDPILLWLFILGLLNTVVSLFYYLKIPYFMYFKKDSNTLNNSVNLGIGEMSFAGLLTVSLIIVFFKADWILNIISVANFTF